MLIAILLSWALATPTPQLVIVPPTPPVVSIVETPTVSTAATSTAAPSKPEPSKTHRAKAKAICAEIMVARPQTDAVPPSKDWWAQALEDYGDVMGTGSAPTTTTP
jgi:hypothetical protein